MRVLCLVAKLDELAVVTLFGTCKSLLKITIENYLRTLFPWNDHYFHHDTI